MPDALSYLAVACAVLAALLLAWYALRRLRALRLRMEALESALSDLDRRVAGAEARLDRLAAGHAATVAREAALRDGIPHLLRELASAQRRLDADARDLADRREARLRSAIAKLARTLETQERTLSRQSDAAAEKAIACAEAAGRRRDAAIEALSDRVSALALAIDRLEDGALARQAAPTGGDAPAPVDDGRSRMPGLAMPARVISVIGP